MPTPPLPLLHALLRALRIPIFPSSLSTISPSLLLLALESIVGRIRLDSRLCATRDDEIAVAKCILGTLAGETEMDLSAVNPVSLVDGRADEMAVVIMGLVVTAKRRGVDVRLEPAVRPAAQDDSMSSEDIEASNAPLPTPLEPDISYYPIISPVRKSRTGTPDVFGSGTNGPILTPMGFSVGRVEVHKQKALVRREDPRPAILRQMEEEFGL
jgi:hypothetical protein